MNAVVALWMGLFPLISTFGISGKSTDYSQSYTILIKGAVAGSEVVSEKTDEDGNLSSSSDHEIFVNDGTEIKRMAFSTKMVLSKKSAVPVSYTCRYTSGKNRDSYEVEVKGDKISRVLTRGGNTTEASVPFRPDMVVLDFNVYHQYDYLVRRYDSKKGGRQQFADFVPVIGNDIPIALTYLGNSTMELNSGTEELRNFRVEFIGIYSGTLTVDKDGRLVRLVVPAQELEVLRSDLTALNQNMN